MNHVALETLEGGDMLDVLHFLYEDDITPRWEQHAAVRSRVREVLYPELYNQQYKYSVGDVNQTAGGVGNGDGFGLPEPPPPGRREVKPYIPPTDPEALEAILGMGPMSG